VDAWINPISGGWIFGRREPFSWDSFDVWVENRLWAGVGTDQADSALATQAGIIQFGKWQHIAVTASTVTGEVWGYVNGVRYPMTVVDGTPVIAGVFRKAHVLIGQRQSPYTMECGGAAAYKGRVDELHIFNRALAPEESNLCCRQEWPLQILRCSLDENRSDAALCVGGVFFCRVPQNFLFNRWSGKSRIFGYTQTAPLNKCFLCCTGGVPRATDDRKAWIKLGKVSLSSSVTSCVASGQSSLDCRSSLNVASD
jgi:hypothetical protein